jgi:hypothetical protein
MAAGGVGGLCTASHTAPSVAHAVVYRSVTAPLRPQWDNERRRNPQPLSGCGSWGLAMRAYKISLSAALLQP